MAAALAPQARAVTVFAPLPHAGASPLPELARFARLSRLTLRTCHATALPALSGLTGLRQLVATGGLQTSMCPAVALCGGALPVGGALFTERTSPNLSPIPLQFTFPAPRRAGWNGQQA